MQKSILLIILAGITISSAMGQKNYENEWKEVESFVRQGLPQSAMKIVDGIYDESRTDNNAPQFLKAALYQVRLKSDYQEDFMESSLAQIGKEIEDAKAPVKQILHSIQAELLWRYYQANRYLFMDRTRLSVPDPDDIKTWDLRTLTDAVARHYLASLEEEIILQQVQLGKFDPIIEPGKNSRIYRPTLYDFLAHRALEFFMHEEPGLTRPAISFSIDQPKYFSPAAEFAILQLENPAEDEFKRLALNILQNLIRFHLNDTEPSALVDVDLQRLRYVEQNAVMAEKHDLYLNALSDLDKLFPDHPATADVGHEIALEYFRRGQQYNPFQSDQYRWDLKRAAEKCDEVIQKYPDTDGAKNCLIVRNRISDKSLSFTLPYANLPGNSFLASLNFKNIDRVYFRIIRMDPEEDRILRQRHREESLIAKYREQPPVREWNLDLPDDGDYQDHNTQVAMPGLPKGYYVAMVSGGADFMSDTEGIAYASFWSTGISYISSGTRPGSELEVFVLDRQKGTALKGVKVQSYIREYDYQSRSYLNRPVDAYASDERGYLSIPSGAGASKSFYLEFRKDDDLFFTENYFYLYPQRREEKSRVTTHFFTDRSIYRPGQTVYFKGIVLEKTGEKHAIRSGHTTTVALYDVNYQKVSELLLTSNEYGSIQGTFTLPSGGLTGEMTLRSESGSISFSVEEYKRPRFRVEIDPLEGNYKLNEQVTVTGKAMAYAGSAVDQAVVSYRVVRMARFPIWRDWWSWFPGTPETEIISGQTMTDAEGAFSLSFTAIPDLQIDPKYQPVFYYKIFADVTDLTGEVRSAETSVSVGYQALLMDADIPGKLDISGPSSFKLHTTNLNNQSVNVEGTITLYSLEAPERLIRDRSWARPDVFVMSREEFLKEFPNELYDNESDPDTWNRKAAILKRNFNTANDSVFIIDNLKNLAAGSYLLLMEATDAFGEKVEVKKYLTAFQPDNKVMPVSSPFWHAVIKNSGEPGDMAVLVVGTAEKNVRLLYEVENKGKIVSRRWLALSQGKTRLEIPIGEDYRGNFSVNLVFVKENRSYQLTEKITVPYTNKQLRISLETFRDKLTPGQDEEWRIRISGMMGEKVTAELLASMYDASLDAFRDHQWQLDLYPYRSGFTGWNTRFAFSNASSRFYHRVEPTGITPMVRSYDQLNWFGFSYYGGPHRRLGGPMLMKTLDAMPGMAAKGEVMEDEAGITAEESPEVPPGIEPEEEQPLEVPIRRNFDETAFFFPALMTDENGEAYLKFTVPESLTAWKLMALAHTKDLKTGYIEKEVITQKELMVMPNTPRFFREGDKIFFSAKVVSLAQERLEGEIMAEFFNAYTMQPIDELMGNSMMRKDFSVEKGSSGVFQWEIVIPEGVEAVVCRVRASTGSMGDGEEIVIPVLPNRMLVTETLPLPVTGMGTKTFQFNKLLNSGRSATIKNYRLTLEFTSNPAWYAVQALPYLLESQRESADNLFNRYYANTLASYIANSNPKIRQVFDYWKNLTPDALLSNLEKNQELKAVILSETPWVVQARNETERKRRIALLFDLNRMADEQQSSLRKLQQMQSPNGGWSWFEGMPDNRYITQLIVTGLGKLHYLGVIDILKNPVLPGMIQRASFYLDERIREDYQRIRERHGDKMDDNHLSPVHVQYLYARSFFMDFAGINQASTEAFDYFREQAAIYWLKQGKYNQAMIALALHRFEVAGVPAEIMKSLKEHALYSEEMGMYWRDLAGFYWWEAPVERQAMLIEAFTEVTGDQESVEKMKVWLLKQKQTQDWKSTRATADAVYALLLRGVDLLAGDELVEVTLGNETIEPLSLDGVQVEAGTGYFQASWHGKEIKPEMGNVKVVKKDEGIAWGAVYWQYFENLDQITPAKTPLSLEKELYIETNTPEGPVLKKVDDNNVLQTGDRLKVRIIIRIDRDLEFVHMKDMRAAAFEPVHVLSGYRYQGGMGYYESIRDASVNFYFDYLRKGTYVFEYPVNVTQQGEFSNGITSIQCLYAPEFSAHSRGIRVKVE
ncbi:MAG: alpha-2-macroglobulin family protein [Bacteroidales bacterium]